MEHNPRLDSLRGIAALAIVSYHWKRAIPFGWIGVSFFFVLSSYLVTSLLIEAKDRHPSFISYYSSFLKRRSLRLLPLYFLFFALVVGVSLASGVFFKVANDLIYLATMTFNYRAIFGVAGDYGHFWSLSVEWQFYILWGLCAWFLSRKNLLKMAIILIPLGMVARIGTWAVLTSWGWSEGRIAGAVMFSSFTYIEAFSYGVLLTDPGIRKGFGSRKVLALCAALTGLGGIFVTLEAWRHGLLGVEIGVKNLGYPDGMVLSHEYLWGYSILALFLASFMAFVIEAKPWDRWLLSPGLRYVGVISYGIYIYHFPIVHFFLKWSPSRPDVKGIDVLLDPLNAVLFAAAVALTLIAAHFSYFFFEKRFLTSSTARPFPIPQPRNDPT
ncbi:Peptidoglycan/LPS O-acetylase OafA/YrhL, contains acyltransferase and SGNH-hydrolase domains [Verrucomicrobium sp. GAS474]|uniref:acyltransferase family protein n=1 Tax=Verrucomicrobium sp. GAS474 TaxID=1882831 RepID=UPI00087B7314|nr:acyltransferase [Verrucomicrobium sp. GAS474]SDT89519.1 Peptidoglycan/LPS O-acetylase OafA/YrhL, contains acyltransferase and SGNH-hydrolase domains [Verrucomicrobium sp. GAS474]